MKIKLSYLDNYPHSYSNPTYLVLDNRPDQVIGECTIYTDDKMNHFADVVLHEPIEESMYIYHITKNVPFIDNYSLEYISLHKEIYNDKPTIRFNEAIISR